MTASSSDNTRPFPVCEDGLMDHVSGVWSGTVHRCNSTHNDGTETGNPGYTWRIVIITASSLAAAEPCACLSAVLCSSSEVKSMQTRALFLPDKSTDLSRYTPLHRTTELYREYFCTKGHTAYARCTLSTLRVADARGALSETGAGVIGPSTFQ